MWLFLLLLLKINGCVFYFTFPWEWKLTCTLPTKIHTCNSKKHFIKTEVRSLIVIVSFIVNECSEYSALPIFKMNNTNAFWEIQFIYTSFFCTFAFCTYVWAVLPGNCCMLKQSVNKNDKMWLIPLTTNMHYGLNSEYSWSINSVNRIFKRLLIKKSIKRDEFKETVICLWLFCK